LSASTPGQRIRVLVFLSGTMDHLEVELGQFFQPAGNLSLRLPKVPQPLQGVVIRPGC
ncbi:hypothetical protein T08_985, partial [Trichinella sp. T8]